MAKKKSSFWLLAHLFSSPLRPHFSLTVWLMQLHWRWWGKTAARLQHHRGSSSPSHQTVAHQAWRNRVRKHWPWCHSQPVYYKWIKIGINVFVRHALLFLEFVSDHWAVWKESKLFIPRYLFKPSPGSHIKSSEPLRGCLVQLCHYYSFWPAYLLKLLLVIINSN